MGMVPDLKGLMREDGISVLAQHTLKPEVVGDGDAPDARVDMQACQNLDIRPSSIVAVLSYTKQTSPEKNQAGNQQSTESGN
jgi:urease alpha subunit